jgi:predicted ester cyclase
MATTATQENIAASRRVLSEAFGEGNLDVVDEVCLGGYVDHDPLLGDQDREGVKRAIASYRAAFPDLAFTVEDAFAADDKVVLRWSAEGTFENEFMGRSPTGERGEPVAGIGIDRYEGDKIAESWGQWDTLRFMRNIGAMADPAQVTSAA